MKKISNQPPGRDKNSDCPEFNLLSAFVEGNLSRQNRDKVFFHLRRCQDCYQLVVESVQLKRELTFDIKDEQAEYLLSSPLQDAEKRKIPGFINKIGKLQGAALLSPVAALFLFLVLFKGHPGWHTDEILKALEADKDFVAISRTFPVEENSRLTLGFNVSMSEQKLAFKSGSLLSRLEISRLAGDESIKNLITEQLDSLLAKSDNTKGLIDSGQLTVEEQIEKVEKYFFDSPVDFYFKLGVFVESGKAYSLVKKSELFDIDYLNNLVKDEEFNTLPPGVTRRFKEIEVLLNKNSIAQKHEIIYNHLQEIQKILS